MDSVTIPKKITKGEDLVVIPKSEYQALLASRMNNVEEITLTPAQKKAYKEALERYRRGESLDWKDVKDEFLRKNR